MKFLRSNDGFTLVELLVTIVVGSIAAAAAATVLILGLRIYYNANDTALKQNEVNIGITVIENLVAEAEISRVESNTVYALDDAGNETALLKRDGNTIVTGANVPILKNVTQFTPTLDGQLLSFVIQVEGHDAPYQFCVYCRLVTVEETTETPENNGGADPVEEGNGALFSLSWPVDTTAVLAVALEDDGLTPNVRAFLNVLDSQQGSTGRIQTGDGEGEYYSEWYIGGYGENSDWNSSTPWCACFVSWALEQCGGYIQGETPRYANVDTFCTDLVTSGDWKKGNPCAGDLIFFDWSADGDYNPEHIGVVIGSDDSRVFTIEGNVNNAVVLCSYELDDARILGYGLVNWAK